MEGGTNLSSLSTARLLELLGEIVAILSLRLNQFGGSAPAPSKVLRPRHTPDRSAFQCCEDCVFCGVRCCRLEPGHTHHKCRDHLRWCWWTTHQPWTSSLGHLAIWIRTLTMTDLEVQTNGRMLTQPFHIRSQSPRKGWSVVLAIKLWIHMEMWNNKLNPALDQNGQWGIGTWSSSNPIRTRNSGFLILDEHDCKSSKQPWESSPINKVFDMSFLQPPKYHVVGFADAMMGVTANPALPTLSTSSSSPSQFIARRLKFASLARDEDVVRRKCLQKRRSIILLDPPATTQLGLSLVDAAGALVTEEEVVQSFKDAFAAKSTATLEKRLAALWPYSKWSLTSHRTPLHMDEPKIYEYLSMLRTEGKSASAPSSFLEAVGFLHNIVDVKSLKGTSSFSGRCKGLAREHLKTRAKRRQAPPLTVEMVSKLETYVGTHFQSHKAGHCRSHPLLRLCLCEVGWYYEVDRDHWVPSWTNNHNRGDGDGASQDSFDRRG